MSFKNCKICITIKLPQNASLCFDHIYPTKHCTSKAAPEGLFPGSVSCDQRHNEGVCRGSPDGRWTHRHCGVSSSTLGTGSATVWFWFKVKMIVKRKCWESIQDLKAAAVDRREDSGAAQKVARMTGQACSKQRTF